MIDIAQEDLYSRNLSLVMATSGWTNKKDDLSNSHTDQSRSKKNASKSASAGQGPPIFTPEVNGNFISSQLNSNSSGFSQSNKKCCGDLNRS